MLSCRETSVSFENQGANAIFYVRDFFLQPKDGVGFSGRLLCPLVKNLRNSRNGGGGLSLYLLHPLTLPLPKKGYPKISRF